MKLLLDTHALLWWLMDDPTLDGQARALIAEPTHAVFVSAASLWELRIKQTLGKVSLPPEFLNVLASQAFEQLDVKRHHTEALASLPMHHRDPFDRC